MPPTAVRLVGRKLPDQALGVGVRVVPPLAKPLVVEQGLRDAQHREAAAHLPAVARAVVRKAPGVRRTVPNVELILLVAGAQHRARNDLDAGRRLRQRDQHSGKRREAQEQLKSHAEAGCGKS